MYTLVPEKELHADVPSLIARQEKEEFRRVLAPKESNSNDCNYDPVSHVEM